jgi:hypothetical protein
LARRSTAHASSCSAHNSANGPSWSPRSSSYISAVTRHIARALLPRTSSAPCSARMAQRAMQRNPR